MRYILEIDAEAGVTEYQIHAALEWLPAKYELVSLKLETDAGLIDAAPAMLVALELAERQLRSWHISTKPASRVDVRVQEAIDAAQSAIRKARGK